MSNAAPAKLFHILRAFTWVNPLRIRQIVKQMPIGDGTFALLVWFLLLLLVQSFPDLGKSKLFFFVADPTLETACAKVFVLAFGWCRFPPGFDRNLSFLALQGAIIVHGQDLEEDLSIFLRIVLRRHQHCKDAGSQQDQGLAPPPFAQSGQSCPDTALRSL
jgi:hypothetical protein